MSCRYRICRDIWRGKCIYIFRCLYTNHAVVSWNQTNEVIGLYKANEHKFMNNRKQSHIKNGLVVSYSILYPVGKGRSLRSTGVVLILGPVKEY